MSRCRSSQPHVPHNRANFGFGTLERRCDRGEVLGGDRRGQCGNLDLVEAHDPAQKEELERKALDRDRDGRGRTARPSRIAEPGLRIDDNDIGRGDARKDVAHARAVERGRIRAGGAPASEHDGIHRRAAEASHAGTGAQTRAGLRLAFAAHDEIRHGRARRNEGIDHRGAQAVEARRDRVGHGGDAGADLHGLAGGIPLIEGEQEVDRSEDEDEHQRHYDRHFDQHGAGRVIPKPGHGCRGRHAALIQARPRVPNGRWRWSET